MTQRIFDVDNPQEIFDLFPDGVIRIEKSNREDEKDIIIFDNDCWDYTHIKINWRDKTEIARPAVEARWIGKLCWVWDRCYEHRALGILKAIDIESERPYQMQDYAVWGHCYPARRDEVQFVDDDETKE